MKIIVELLQKANKTIATMESCTGGYLVNSITNISGSSDVLKFSAVTYSNEFKIKMGVNKDIIDKYSVYSLEVAKEMSLVISNYTNSDYGVGITGKINDIDINNLFGEDNKVFVSIYDKNNNQYYTKEIKTINSSREDNKKRIVKIIKDMLIKIIG
ncbi:MAG: CinA family protein [Mollicutes bacterium]|nr:CinA family protein [Mollicutes bacterium]